MSWLLLQVYGSNARGGGDDGGNDRAWALDLPLDIDMMKQAATMLTGTHVGTSSVVDRSSVATVEDIQVECVPLEGVSSSTGEAVLVPDSQMISVSVKGSSFLPSQVCLLRDTTTNISYLQSIN